MSNNLDASDIETVTDALLLALRFAENEYETRGPTNDADYEVKAGDVIADVRHALDVLKANGPTKEPS